MSATLGRKRGLALGLHRAGRVIGYLAIFSIGISLAQANSLPRMTCNYVGDNDLQPGQSPGQLYQDLDRKRVYWEQMEAVAARNGRREEAETYRFYATNCAEKRDEAAARIDFEYWYLDPQQKNALTYARTTLANLVRVKGWEKIGFVGSDRCFYTKAAFDQWLKNTHRPDPVRDQVAYAASTRREIHECVTKVKDGESLRIKPHWRPTKCTENFWPPWEHIRTAHIGYTVRKEDGIFVVDHGIAFAYEGAARNQKKVYERVFGLKGCVEDFYARFGLRLNLHFSKPPDLEGYKKAETIVKLTDHAHETDTNIWPILSVKGNEKTEDQVCSTMVHEIGHHLGLEDLYEGGCPAYQHPPNSSLNVMTASYVGARSADLEGWQVRTIIAPLCDGTSAYGESML